MAIIWYKFFRRFKLCQNVGAQIPLPPMDEKKKVIEDVDKDRRYAIDASIVRIMKSRKVLPHQQLVLECVEQLGRMFKVSLLFLSLFMCQVISSHYTAVHAYCWPGNYKGSQINDIVWKYRIKQQFS